MNDKKNNLNLSKVFNLAFVINFAPSGGIDAAEQYYQKLDMIVYNWA